MLFFKETRKTGDIVKQITSLDEDDRFEGIRCPLCAWRPSSGDLWCCFRDDDSPEPPFRSCGTIWNTFATRGRCTGCSHQWKWTSCLRCSAWSLHEDWYERRS
ncbi:MAG: hypothetical protein K2Y23_17765 [Cyanobacteria bacterium]|nr:hypothetical protein [Cyanobacteriota bacterium]